MTGSVSGSSVGSVEDMLTAYYDITSVPSQSVLGKLVPFATSSKDRDNLQVLSADQELYDHWQVRGVSFLL